MKQICILQKLELGAILLGRYNTGAGLIQSVDDVLLRCPLNTSSEACYQAHFPTTTHGRSRFWCGRRERDTEERERWARTESTIGVSLGCIAGTRIPSSQADDKAMIGR